MCVTGQMYDVYVPTEHMYGMCVSVTGQMYDVCVTG